MTDNNTPKHDEDFDIDVEDIGATDAELEEFFGENESGSMEYDYYIVGDLPLRIGYIALGVPVIAEIFDGETKGFIIDNTYISYAAENTEIIEINEQEFTDECLKRGAKPPEKKA